MFAVHGHTELLLGRTTWRLGGQTGVLEAGLGGLERHLSDNCVLLNGLGRFQNALGMFQEAPERESLIFHWFWEVFWGGVKDAHAAPIPTRRFSDPLKH